MRWKLPAIIYVLVAFGANAFAQDGPNVHDYSQYTVTVTPQQYKSHKRQRDFRMKTRPKKQFRINPNAPTRGAGILHGVTPVLAAKAQQIVAACGSRVISGVARRRIAGSSRMSMHASGNAVDIAGNPSCIYAQLKDWPGGYTTDYHRVSPNHVHISYGGREHGLRFAHGGSRKKRAWPVGRRVVQSR